MNINPIGANSPNPPKPNFSGLNGGKFFGLIKNAASGAADAGAKEPGKIKQSITKGLTWFLDNCSKVPGFKYFAKMANSSEMMFGAATSLLVAGILRPLAIFALPDGKGEKEREQSKKDKGNAAGHAISSALVGFFFTVSIAEILKRGYKNSTLANGIKEFLSLGGQSKFVGAYEKVCKFAPENVIAIPRALLTAVAAAPIGTFLNKHVFGINSAKEKEQKKQLPEQPQEEPQIDKPVEDLGKQIPVAQNPTTSQRPLLDAIRGVNAE